MNWSWIASNVGAIADAALDHVVLTGLAVGVGFAISLVFALLIFVRNIVAGFESVPREVLEAADGMG